MSNAKLIKNSKRYSAGLALFGLATEEYACPAKLAAWWGRFGNLPPNPNTPFNQGCLFPKSGTDPSIKMFLTGGWFSD